MPFGQCQNEMARVPPLSAVTFLPAMPALKIGSLACQQRDGFAQGVAVSSRINRNTANSVSEVESHSFLLSAVQIWAKSLGTREIHMLRDPAFRQLTVHKDSYNALHSPGNRNLRRTQQWNLV